MRPSSIDRLEAPIREEINRLRVDKGYTIEQIVAHLAAMEIPISKSAMGRHVLKIEAVAARIREARALAEGIAPQLSDDNKAAGLNIELLHSAVMRLLSWADDPAGEDAPLKPMEVMLLSKSLDHLAKAQKINTDRILKVRQETAEKGAKAAEKIAVKQGLSKETVDAIKHAVLGVATT